MKRDGNCIEYDFLCVFVCEEGKKIGVIFGVGMNFYRATITRYNYGSESL
jgi:hypothetical protein